MEALHRNTPPLPFNEAERLRALLDSCILDTEQDPAFDAITRAASVLMETPIAAVSLIDQHRQWFKSSVGIDLTATAREDAFCSYAILQREPLIVLDARLDARFAGNPFVTGAPCVRFYVGVPVRSDDGLPLGALFVADFSPRGTVDLRLLQMLRDLAETVEAMIRVRRTTQYVDRASGLPNQRRFHENAASLRVTALLSQETGGEVDALRTGSDVDAGQPLRGWSSRAAMAASLNAGGHAPSEYWAVCVEGVTSVCADDWIERGKAARIDRQLEGVATWLRSAAVTCDGVYRLSARHLGFFVVMPRAAVSRLVGMLARDLSPIIGHPDSTGSAASVGATHSRHRAPGGANPADAAKGACEALDASIGELQIVAMNVVDCEGVTALIAALMAPRAGMTDTSTDTEATLAQAPLAPHKRSSAVATQSDDGTRAGATIHTLSGVAGALDVSLSGSRQPERAIADDFANDDKPTRQESVWGTAMRVPSARHAMGADYDPARDGCQMRVNLCEALAEGFDVTVPDQSGGGDVLALHGAGLLEPAAPTGGFRGTAGAAEVTLGVAQRRALLDWFSRWWTMERRTSARLQLRGGLALLEQSPQQWLNDLLHVGLLPAQLEVAVPLSALREHFANTQRRVRAWREAGIGVVITGFGAGFDTVRWLPTLPLTGVSFDPRVIDAVRQLPKHARVVQRLVSLAHALGMRVGVDGLQDECALRIARGLGIDEGSGDAAGRVLSIQDGGAVVPRIDPLATPLQRVADQLGRCDPQGADSARVSVSTRSDRPAGSSERSDGVFTRDPWKTAVSRSIARPSAHGESAYEQRTSAILRLVGDDPKVPGCQHGETCTAGCIPSRTTTRDSITRASLYPRFRFQS
jgi:EAL domain-containing protein (putative c-di-GMP-specific phosphodiesterase class I)